MIYFFRIVTLTTLVMKVVSSSQIFIEISSHTSTIIMSGDECIKNYLPPDFMPTAKDVVCARGKEAFLHPGNKRYRDIIDLNLDKYKGAKNKNEKSKLVMEIVEEVRQDAPAGLIRYCDVEQLWYEIGDEAASKYRCSSPALCDLGSRCPH